MVVLRSACRESFHSLLSRECTDPEERSSRQFLRHFWLSKCGYKKAKVKTANLETPSGFPLKKWTIKRPLFKYWAIDSEKGKNTVRSTSRVACTSFIPNDIVMAQADACASEGV